ncbi:MULTISPECIES: GNAT family N-acetyltransferase [Cyanophyceae]|uniref:GNAT family N-acetyltransferase n=1 Tax=Cyanophyceae TaxID=3028117 RepID=UPI0016890F76|nr:MULTISPECIES: GNAT family N-acetyltransferase [Cyanophyceae]MBD1914728.1 GNAT family N-acetyltransferase [Phormidium sp. FACHB-77]MBD2030831.1 GNAT family N-acetyltransferase [Phormidium sp. FACHB-322]MBD2052430.1 GNAT family N-acetyltransferase [Leptolyngbya sp. FACHB-60]
MSQILHTDHLMLRPSTVADLDAVHMLWTDPDIRRFLFDDRPISRREASDFLAVSNESFAQQGYGLWLFFERPGEAIAPSSQSSTIAGFSGLIAVPDQPPSLVFGTRPQLWGRGYAKEATAAVLRYVFDELGVAQVVADVDEPNTASIYVLESLGMVRTGQVTVNDRPLLYYALQASA